MASGVTDQVLIATPDQEIIDACNFFGAPSILTRSDHPTGTDRIAEVAEKVRQGIEEANSSIPCITILDESEAIAAALDSAPQSSLVVVFPDKVDSAIAIIESRKSKMSS